MGDALPLQHHSPYPSTPAANALLVSDAIAFDLDTRLVRRRHECIRFGPGATLRVRVEPDVTRCDGHELGAGRIDELVRND